MVTTCIHSAFEPAVCADTPSKYSSPCFSRWAPARSMTMPPIFCSMPSSQKIRPPSLLSGRIEFLRPVRAKFLGLICRALLEVLAQCLAAPGMRHHLGEQPPCSHGVVYVAQRSL